jgi:hypothetical protein
MKNTATWTTGGLSLDDELDNAQIFAQILVVYIVAILMLNLLVGVLSEKLAEVHEQKEISTF